MLEWIPEKNVNSWESKIFEQRVNIISAGLLRLALYQKEMQATCGRK